MSKYRDPTWNDFDDETKSFVIAEKLNELREIKGIKNDTPQERAEEKANITAACNDILDFLDGKMSKEEFIVAYKKQAGNIHYSSTIGDLMQSGMNNRYFIDSWSKYSGMSEDKTKELFAKQSNFEATKKIVNALFDVAYTRVPNNEKGSDGKPVSYSKTVNDGYAAGSALKSLSNISEKSQEMNYLRTEYAYPRAGADYKVDNRGILESVKSDVKSYIRNENMKSLRKIKGQEQYQP